MTRLSLLFVSIFMLGACDKFKGSPSLDTDQKKASYAIGIQMGQSLKAQGIKADVSVLAAGISDSLNDAKPKLTPEEMQGALMKMSETAHKENMAKAGENLEKGKKFLEENKGKPNVKTLPSGLQYEVLKEGTGKSPKATDMVRVHYQGTFIDGKEFDSSVKRGTPAEFPLNGVIKGWTEGLQTMKVGGKTKFVIPPDLAYGEMGRPNIPPQSVLVFEVELLDILKPEKPLKDK